MTTDSKEVMLLERRIVPVVKKAELLEIVNTETMREATTLLSEMNKVADRITEEKEKITKPLNEALKAERGRWKPIETIYQDGIALLRQKMGTYQTKRMREIREEEERIAARVAPGKGNLSLETAAKKLAELDTIPDAISTDAGSVTFRTDKKLLITNVDEIPREYMLPDEKRLLTELRAGKIIPGVTIEEVQVPVNVR